MKCKRTSAQKSRVGAASCWDGEEVASAENRPTDEKHCAVDLQLISRRSNGDVVKDPNGDDVKNLTEVAPGTAKFELRQRPGRAMWILC